MVRSQFRWAYIVFAVIFGAAVVFQLVARNRPIAVSPISSSKPSPTATSDISDSTLGLTLDCGLGQHGGAPPHPHPLTKQQAKAYVALYDTPPVRGLRAALEAYRLGKADDDTVRSLRPYGRALASDGFHLLLVQGAFGGGNLITLQFTHHPDALYGGWVYMLDGKMPSIRAFVKGVCTPAEQRWNAVALSPWKALGDDRSLMSRPLPTPPDYATQNSK